MIVIRVVGMLVTLAASSALGVYFSGLANFRMNDLLEMKKALLVLKSEIDYVATPLPEAVANIAAKISDPISGIFSCFAERLNKNEGETAYRLWLWSIESNKQDTYLNEEDLEAIGNFGKTLGYLDKQMQLDSIRFTIDYIEAQIADLQEANQKNGRMYKTLGVIGGLLLLVVFW